MNGLQETVVIWAAECLRLLRSARVVVLLGLYGFFSAVVLLGVALLRPLVEALVRSGFIAESGPIPLAVYGVFYLSLFFLPVYAALLGFDQLSGEVGPRSIRYLTVRARRTSVVLGKLLAQTTLVLGLVFGLDLVLCVYAGAVAPSLQLAPLALQLVKFWGTSAVFCLAFLALTSLCSSVTSTPAVSLVLNLTVLMFSLLLWMTAAADPGNPVRVLRYLSPLRYSPRLLSPHGSEVATSLGVYVLFTALFLGGSLWALRTRDL